MEELIGMTVAEFPLNASDLVYLKMAIQLAEKWFGPVEKPVEFLDSKPHEIQGHITVVVLYSKPEDLFFLGAATARLKETQRFDKMINYVNYEVKELLTFRSN